MDKEKQRIVEVLENQLSDLNKLRQQLFEDEKDPRSSAYIRVLNRPTIRWWRIAFWVLSPMLLAAALGFGMYRLAVPGVVCVTVPIVLWLVYCLLSAKRAVICLVRIYQRYAPATIRNRCMFEPSCSEYTIQVLEKYGLIRGIKKSIGRFRRCNVNGGGFDFP